VGTDTGCDFGATNLSALSSLSNLYLENNDLSGSLPPWIDAMSSLEASQEFIVVLFLSDTSSPAGTSFAFFSSLLAPFVLP